jgi:hypothetical protein
MQRGESVFYHLVKDEDSLSELLCNLLRYPGLRAILRRLISAAVGNAMPPFLFRDVSSQVRTADGSERPDFVIRADNWFVAVESKRGSRGLTAAQRQGYPETFDEVSEELRYLIFLVPEGYCHSPEIHELRLRCKRATVAIVSWTDLVESVQSSAMAKGEIFREFLALVTKWFTAKTVMIPEEGTMSLNVRESGSAYYAVLELITSVQQNMSGTHSTTEEINDDGYGFAVNDSHGQALWFGIDYDFWKQTGYVLSLAVDKCRKVKGDPVAIGLKKPKYSDPRWEIYGVPPRLYTKKGNGGFLRDVLVDLAQRLESPHGTAD